MQLMFYANISKKMKDKTDMLFEAIEHPDRFSEEEILNMLKDNELKELYMLMNKTSDALTETDEPDIDDEWKYFVRRNSKSESAFRHFHHSFRIFFNRNVAVILICIVASLAVVAATLGITYSFGHTRIKQEAQKPDVPVATVAAMADTSVDKDSVSVADAAAAEPDIIVFKDESFAAIDVIAGYYGAIVNCDNDKAKELRLYFQWDQKLPLADIIDQLNSFEQIDINLTDNVITIK